MERQVEVIGHGGAGHYHPLNSLASIEKAIEIGVDRIEIDVQPLGDGAVVLFHDRHWMAESRRIRLRSGTLAELLKVHPDVVTLNDLLEMNISRVPLFFDLKDDSLTDNLVKAVKSHHAEDYVSACSTSFRAIRALHEAAPDLRLSLSWGAASKYIPSKSIRARLQPAFGALTVGPFVAACRLAGAREATIYYRTLSKSTITTLHSAGIRVIAWTVDKPDDVRSLLEMGVDGITSNRPGMVIGILQEVGYSSD